MSKILTASQIRAALITLDDADRWLGEIEKEVGTAAQAHRFEWVRFDISRVRDELLHVSLADVAVEETAP